MLNEIISLALVSTISDLPVSNDYLECNLSLYPEQGLEENDQFFLFIILLKYANVS